MRECVCLHIYIYIYIYIYIKYRDYLETIYILIFIVCLRVTK